MWGGGGCLCAALQQKGGAIPVLNGNRSKVRQTESGTVEFCSVIHHHVQEQPHQPEPWTSHQLTPSHTWQNPSMPYSQTSSANVDVTL